MAFEDPIIAIVETLLPASEDQRRQLTKPERVGIVFKTIEQLPAARSDAEALWFLCTSFMVVEDRCTSAPYLPDASNYKVRMYGPSQGTQKQSEKPNVWKFRATAHIIWIGVAGAIRVEQLNAGVIFEKAGADGMHIS